MKIRDFTPSDYERWADIHNKNYPDHPRGVEELRHEEDSWSDPEKYERRVLVLEDGSGGVAGIGSYNHIIWQYHPRKYEIDLLVVSELQGQGYGSALYERIMADLGARNALSARTEARESMASSMDFLRHRGFREITREWESRLEVSGFPFERFAKAETHFREQGFEISTLKREMERDPDAARGV